MLGIKVAAPTKGDGGLDDVLSNVFVRAKTFTIIDMEEKAVKGVEIKRNPTISFKHGAGPVVVKCL